MEFSATEEFLDKAIKLASVIERVQDERGIYYEMFYFDQKHFDKLLSQINPSFNQNDHLLKIKNDLCTDWKPESIHMNQIKEIWFTRDQLIELINYVKQVK